MQFERALFVDLINGVEKTELFSGMGGIGAELKQHATQHAYVIGPVSIDRRDLPSNVHSSADAYDGVVSAFDPGGPSRVYLIRIRVVGYVQSDNGDEALRMNVRINGVFNNKISDRGASVDDYCFMYTEGGQLRLASRAGIRS